MWIYCVQVGETIKSSFLNYPASLYVLNDVCTFIDFA